MKITLAKLNELKACGTGIIWFEKRYGYAAAEHEQYKQDLLADEKFGWIFWAINYVDEFKKVVSAKELDKCAEKDPWAALKYAAKLLTKARLDWCAEQWPGNALRHAAELITKKRLDWCAEQWPGNALKYAAKLLTKARLDWCAEKDPWAALEFASNLLTEKRKIRCEKQIGE